MGSQPRQSDSITTTGYPPSNRSCSIPAWGVGKRRPCRQSVPKHQHLSPARWIPQFRTTARPLGCSARLKEEIFLVSACCRGLLLALSPHLVLQLCQAVVPCLGCLRPPAVREPGSERATLLPAPLGSRQLCRLQRNESSEEPCCPPPAAPPLPGYLQVGLQRRENVVGRQLQVCQRPNFLSNAPQQ